MRIMCLFLGVCLASCAADPSPEDRVSLDSDSSEVVQALESSVRLTGEHAKALWGVMEDAGYFKTHESGSLSYLYGSYLVCVTNGEKAACRIHAPSQGSDAHALATIHGKRFSSAASELFGALANSQGISPATVYQIDRGPFDCAKNTKLVWCSIAPMEDTRVLEVSFSGLPDLGDDAVYEGWIIVNGQALTAGRFSHENEGDIHEYAVPADVADDVTAYVLTIEPTVDPDPGPSSTHIVAGDFSGDSAELVMDHPAALGTDFSDADGSYILATPSTADVDDDYGFGVWFLNPKAGAASLALPELPNGWVYEGWVVGPDGPVTTGRFVDPAAADRDGGGPSAGPDGTPPFPGQDFIAPPRDLRGGAVVISVEPEPDNSPLPFALKPLIDGLVSDLPPPDSQMLMNRAADSAISGAAIWR